MEILASLKVLYPSFTPVERDIADYIQAHGEQVVYMTISELAMRCGVGETSIVRFCRHIGQSGYPDFRVGLASALEAEKARSAALPKAFSDPYDKLLEEVYRKHLLVLNQTRGMLENHRFHAAAEMILSAGQLYFFGYSRSLSGALTACQALLTISGKGVCALDLYTQQMQASIIQSEDLALFFSFDDADDELVKVAEKVRERNAASLLFTARADSPLTRLCSLTLHCGSPDASQPSPLDALAGNAAALFILEALCAVCQKRQNGEQLKLEAEKAPRPEPFFPFGAEYPTF